MFPKYKSGPINGDTVSDSDLNREKMKIDISALLGGDVYSLLRTRSERAQSRFSKERDADKALAERQKCLTKLASLASDVFGIAKLTMIRNPLVGWLLNPRDVAMAS